MAPAAVINYADVVADLRFRATRLNEAASILEGMMGETETPAPPAAAAQPTTQMPAAAPRKTAVSKKKASGEKSNEGLTLAATVLNAIKERPKTPEELVRRTLQLRPGSNIPQIPRAAFSLKIRGKIEKHLGQWRVTRSQSEAELEPVPESVPAVRPATAKPAQVPAMKEPSIRDLIREAIARGQKPTMEEVVERVQRVMPSLPAANIKTAVGQLIIGGEAKQTFGGVIEAANLKMPAAVNGAAH